MFKKSKDIQSLLTNFLKLKIYLFGEYRQSLEFVDKTLEIQETADAYALKGTLFMLENITAARANGIEQSKWIKYSNPSIPELETLIQRSVEDNNK